MIDLYTFGTPNGHKIPIALEELELPYRVNVIDIGKGEQKTPGYLKINPNGKIPAIVDQEGPGGQPFTLFESGAILIYLADKTGRLLPNDVRGRHQALAWLMFQMSAVGPIFGQTNHFVRFAKEKVPYAIERFRTESARILGVLEGQLAGQEYLAPAYSIADIATYPWVQAMKDGLPEFFEKTPAVNAWLARVGARPAVKKGMTIPEPKK